MSMKRVGNSMLGTSIDSWEVNRAPYSSARWTNLFSAPFYFEFSKCFWVKEFLNSNHLCQSSGSLVTLCCLQPFVMHGDCWAGHTGWQTQVPPASDLTGSCLPDVELYSNGGTSAVYVPFWYHWFYLGKLGTAKYGPFQIIAILW